MVCGPSSDAPHLRATLGKAEGIWNLDWRVCLHVTNGVIVAFCVPIASPYYFLINEKWREFPPASFLMTFI